MVGLAIERMLRVRDRPTVIILQSDHGPGSQLHWDDLKRSNATERLAILYALYFPDRDYSDCGARMTPVNSFRLVVNRYLGFRYRVLEGRSFLSNWEEPYRFVEVP
jgi:hypothetical protein